MQVLHTHKLKSLAEALFRFSPLFQTIIPLVIPSTCGLSEAFLIMWLVLLVNTMNSLTEDLKIDLCVRENPNVSQVLSFPAELRTYKKDSTV